jgi:dihydroorotate dehydrogenase (NAD+) catalytic subunit
VRRVVEEARELPVWAKLSPNAPDIPAIASAAHRGGANAVTLVNTLSGLDIDVESGRPSVGNVYGGVSGPLLLPVALRAVHQVYRECPGLPIVGVGGITCGEDAVKMLMAGASAVQVGTANFADPHATHRVLDELHTWCADHGTTPAQLTGRSHPRE